MHTLHFIDNLRTTENVVQVRHGVYPQERDVLPVLFRLLYRPAGDIGWGTELYVRTGQWRGWQLRQS